MTTADPRELSGCALIPRHRDDRNAPRDDRSLGRPIGMRLDRRWTGAAGAHLVHPSGETCVHGTTTCTVLGPWK